MQDYDYRTTTMLVTVYVDRLRGGIEVYNLPALLHLCISCQFASGLGGPVDCLILPVWSLTRRMSTTGLFDFTSMVIDKKDVNDVSTNI